MFLRNQTRVDYGAPRSVQTNVTTVMILLGWLICLLKEKLRLHSEEIFSLKMCILGTISSNFSFYNVTKLFYLFFLFYKFGLESKISFWTSHNMFKYGKVPICKRISTGGVQILQIIESMNKKNTSAKANHTIQYIVISADLRSARLFQINLYAGLFHFTIKKISLKKSFNVYCRGSQTVCRDAPGSCGLFTGAPRSFIIN